MKATPPDQAASPKISHSSLLLSEVVMRSGEHHLVLLVRTSSGDFVLDNLTPRVKPWSRTPYRWVRVQSAGNVGLWATVGREGV
ncbi:transglutaminase-like cysteine peptidase [Bradyrhizobium liaoningense]